MPRYTIITGLFLIFLGAYGYLSYDSVTVLIPAFIGLLIMTFGILAINEKRRRMFIHLAIVIAVIGLSASIKSVLSIPGLIECSGIGDGTIKNCSLFCCIYSFYITFQNTQLVISLVGKFSIVSCKYYCFFQFF